MTQDVLDPRVLVVTTMNEDIYHATGDKMLATGLLHWGGDCRFRVYAEGFSPEGRYRPVEWRDLYKEAPWLDAFRAYCDMDPARCGLTTGGVYDFRLDARKFACKVAALTAAGLELAGRSPPMHSSDWPELLVWLDADTLTHEPVDSDWLAGLVPPGSLLGWLDRRNLYPETGCLIFRPAHPEFGGLMVSLRDAYARHDVFHMAEWHDAHVIGRFVSALVSGGVRVASLSGTARGHPHPFVNGPLGGRMDHMKGPRKNEGRSRTTDLSWRRPERYWRT